MVPLTLPEDLMVEVLLRLPVKCLLRLKCVCKGWFSLISDSKFAKKHYDLAAVPTHRVLKFLNDFEGNSVDVEGDDSAVIVFNTPLPSHSPIASEYIHILHIVGFCRGFTLLEITTRFGFTDLVVWNPSTGIHKRINCDLQEKNTYQCGIGYDSSTDDYVVVVLTFPAGRAQPTMLVDYYSFRTNSWSLTQTTTARYHALDDIVFNQAQFLNGSLHWPVLDYSSVELFITFDVSKKTLSEIPISNPDLSITVDCALYHLMGMGECLCFCLARYENGTPVFEMWTMMEYKVQSSWTKSFVCSTLHGPIYPLCFTKNGQILGLNYYSTLVTVDEKGELLEHCTHNKYGGGCCKLHGVYRESLLSLPNQQ